MESPFWYGEGNPPLDTRRSPMRPIRVLPLTLVVFGSALAHGAPDLIVGSIDGANHWGQVGDIHGYSFGVTYCNIGDTPASVVDGTAEHPVLSMGMYSYDPSTMRFTMIGISHVEHQFAALPGNVCGECTPSGNFQQLGIGCSTVTSAGLMGAQGDLGPRSEVDAYYSAFSYPFTGINQNGNAIFKRLQARESALSVPDARFFFESIVVANDDANAGNQNNNVSWRETTINPVSFSAIPVGDTDRESAAINAWKAIDPGVLISERVIVNQGVVLVGSRAHDLGDGTYRYDYNVYNQNLSNGLDEFWVPLSTAPSEVFFSAVDHHSTIDENIDDSSWAFSAANAKITWTPVEVANPALRNTIRWGTMHTFSFVTNAPPVLGQVVFDGDNVLGSFVDAWVPETTSCAADLNGDTFVDFFDLSFLLSNRPDYNGDTMFDFFDLSSFLNDAQSCP